MTKNIWKQFHKKSITERLDVLKQANYLTADQIHTLLNNGSLSTDLANNMSENVVATYGLPFGLALNFKINDADYIVPMAIEEPSVVAAASYAAQIIARNGGYQTSVLSRLMTGQIAFTGIETAAEAEILANWIADHAEGILQIANEAYPSIVKRGGGARSVRSQYFPADEMPSSFFVVYLTVDTQEAMGANLMNTMLEALKIFLTGAFNHMPAAPAAAEREKPYTPLMAILSNYTTDCVVEASCQIKASHLSRPGISGPEAAHKIALASQLAAVDQYRATTHNKGIMNGIDAVLIATGNDWRAIEAGAHSYAARSGRYRGLTTWEYDAAAGLLKGKLTLPMPIGVVGGSIGIHPTAKIAHQLLNNPSAQELMQILAAVGLGQNLAAMRALVSEGIQSGHMALQARSLAIQVGAAPAEVEAVTKQLQQAARMDQATATEILAKLRTEK